MTIHTILKSAALAAAILAFAVPAHAVSDSSADVSATTTDAQEDAAEAAADATMSCEAPAALYDPAGETCVAECPEGSVPNEEGTACEAQEAYFYRQGRQLALDGQYDKALAVFAAGADRSDPMVLTMTGFALRKSGRLEEGIALYHQALAIDPDNPFTLEYLGEGYVASGNMSLALEQLHRLKTTCGADCDQYRQLAAVISGHAAWQ